MPAADEAGCDAPPAFVSARPITPADLAAVTERVRRRVIRWFVIRGADGRIRSVLPGHKAASWVGPGRGRKSTRPGANGIVELSPFEFLDRLADLVPPPRKHRHRYHGVFAPNPTRRRAVTALAIGNIGKLRDAGAIDLHSL